MLDAIKDHGNAKEELASSRKEGSSKAIVVKTDHVSNWMVYKLVKVRDDGSLLAATEDDVFQSLVEGPKNGLASNNLEASSDVIEEEEEDNGESDYIASDGEDFTSTNEAKSVPIQDLAVERQRLKAQIEVLDCILMRVNLEERRRLFVENEVGKSENPSSTYIKTFGVEPGEYKRQRRPNPKYFNAVYDVADLDSTFIRPPILSSEQPMLKQIISSSQKAPSESTIDVIVNSPRRVTTRRGLAQHRTRSSLLKTFTKIPSKFYANHTSMSLLDNLSIRELHKVFCSTYGRETSVKDKHWLKRQILAGWMRHEEDHDVGKFMRSTTTTTATTTTTTTSDNRNKLEARLDASFTQQAEQPLQTIAIVTPTLNQRNHTAIDQDAIHHLEHNLSDYTFRSRLGSRCFQRRMTTPAIISNSCIYGEVVNNGDLIVESKRQRKPNRRYIEDEAYVVSGFVPVHETRSSFYRKTHELRNLTRNYSWKIVERDKTSSDLIGRYNNVCLGPKRFPSIQRPKHISSGMKRKVGGRAAKLVKMAHNLVAHAPRHDDTNSSVYNGNLIHLRATPNIITEDGIMAKINGNLVTGSHWASTAIVQKFDPPNMIESANVVQPSLVLDNNMMRLGGDQITSDLKGQQMVVMKTTTVVSTVPTASGGTRRKHHRPWTLREVVTLIEGVARCGGGKWADIKKLAFSTVAYRTAVDLKDKWRNLLRASRVQLHPTKQGERKKHFAATIPAPILSRVRELASIPNQIPSTTITSVIGTSRRGRNVHLK